MTVKQDQYISRESRVARLGMGFMHRTVGNTRFPYSVNVEELQMQSIAITFKIVCNNLK